MKYIILSVLIILLLATAAAAQAFRVYTLDAKLLVAAREATAAGSKEHRTALEQLEKDARKALRRKPVSVVEKDQIPPSGDKHDYMSLSRYWWPDPNKPDGLPYVQRDGETNPESEKIPDHKNFNILVASVTTLGCAFFFTEKREYAEHAAIMMRAWFIDTLTRMNPHMQYAQSVPGRSEGRGVGILDFRDVALLLDAVGMMSLSDVWMAGDEEGLKQWLRVYLKWLRESPNGNAEFNAKNNHGSWYDAQAIAVTMYIGDFKSAKGMAENVKTKRIAGTIESDGRQLAELSRTRSWHYSVFNLTALFRAALLAEKLGVDLWNYRTDDGRCLRTALDYLIPFALQKREWEYEQIGGLDRELIYPLLIIAGLKYVDEKYRAVAQSLNPEDSKSRRTILLYNTR